MGIPSDGGSVLEDWSVMMRMERRFRGSGIPGPFPLLYIPVSVELLKSPDKNSGTLDTQREREARRPCDVAARDSKRPTRVGADDSPLASGLICYRRRMFVREVAVDGNG